MARFAKGKRSKAISDRSGFEVPYTQLKTTWDNLRVEPEEFEVKHPRLTPPKNIIDATALLDPRPDNDPEPVTIFLNYNWLNTNITSMQASSYKKPELPVGKGNIGFVSFEIENTSISGVAGTGATGTEVLELSIDEAGVGAVGVEALSLSITESGVAGTGAIGTEVPEASITESGVAGTGAIGTVSIETNRGYGEAGWNTGTWGE